MALRPICAICDYVNPSNLQARMAPSKLSPGPCANLCHAFALQVGLGLTSAKGDVNNVTVDGCVTLFGPMS